MSSGFLPSYTPGVVATFAPSNPTAPASTAAYKMQGLGSTFVPAKSGNVVAIWFTTVTASATTVGNGINLQGYCGLIQGSNVAPANAAAVPGNAVKVGGVITFATGVTLTTAADLLQPLTAGGVVTGLTLGQQYWFDLAAESVTTVSDNAITNVQVIIFEV